MKKPFLTLLVLFPMLCKHSVAQIMDKKSIIAPGAKVEKLGDGFAFTEGPAADTDGNVYFTDQPNNKIIRWDAETKELTTFLSKSGRSNGTFFDQKGHLLACADMNNQLWSIDTAGNHTVLVANYKGKRLNGPNDLWIAPNGSIYFTDPLYKRDYWTRDPEMQQQGMFVYRLDTDRKTVSLVEESLERPNGIVGSSDGKKLYIADIGGSKTYVYDIDKNGELIHKKLFTNMGSDGMTIDNKGNLYLTGEGVTVFDKKGKKIAHIPIAEDWTANICFGGKSKSMIFITASKGIYGLEMNVKGVD